MTNIVHLEVSGGCIPNHVWSMVDDEHDLGLRPVNGTIRSMLECIQMIEDVSREMKMTEEWIRSHPARRQSGLDQIRQSEVRKPSP